ncbi:dTDP-4-dehydrorhamnose reductase [Paenibacillus sp. NPDC056579]|uniref:dTDP-4-dehydrorhamnose reductase n=1 Tax=Paenibacillus sp. NPDC056579 TaxID=3345871 RepID=UPI0036CAFDC9
MNILVTGYNGQLGYDVVREGGIHNLNIIGVSRKDLDITNELAVRKYVLKIKPDVIIHCAAYTAVDKAESDREQCWLVNVEGTKYLARAAKEINSKFMYISTDYVFDGNGSRPYLETDIPNPISYYGLTKYEGEQLVQAILNEYFIIRTSWVFGLNGKNFVKTMLQLAEQNNKLKVVSDQFGSPTYTKDLARLLIDIIQTDKYGVYHATNEGFCSWADFAQEIFIQSSKSITVERIKTQEYPTVAVRPKNSCMSKKKLVDNGFEPLPLWQEAVFHYLNEIKP